MGRLKRWLGLERRSTLRDPPDWLRTAIGAGSETLSGETIGPDSALSVSSYYAALRCVSEDIGKLPLLLYDRVAGKGRVRLDSHPLYRLIHDQPNPEMSSQSFRETLTSHALGWGNGFAEIVRTKGGRAVELWPIAPNRVRIDRVKKRIVYTVRPALNEPEEILDSADMFHLHGLGFDGITGYSIAHLARESLGIAKAQEKSAAALFGNLGRPGTAIKLATTLTDEAKVKLAKQFQAAHAGGAGNWYRTVVLEQGTELSPLPPINPKDAEWIASRQFTVGDLARWLRVAPHKIGLLTDATYSNIAEQRVEYVVDTLTPWATRWEHQIRSKLLPARGTMFAEHLFEGLLRGTTKERFEAYNLAIQGGYMSRNQARIAENWAPEPGLDEFLLPLNTAAVGGNEVN